MTSTYKVQRYQTSVQIIVSDGIFSFLLSQFCFVFGREHSSLLSATMHKFYSLIYFALLFVSCGSVNILFLNGIPSPSHHLWNRVLIRGLAAKGHNITMVSVDNDKNPYPNIHYIFMEETYPTLYGNGDGFDLLEFAETKPIAGVIDVNDWCDLACDGVLKSKGLDQIINYPDDFKFDLVLYDFTCGPCMLPLMHKFKYPPLIAVTAYNNPPFTMQLVGGQKYPATVPHYYSEYSNMMSLYERLMNHLLYFLDNL